MPARSRRRSANGHVLSRRMVESASRPPRGGHPRCFGFGLAEIGAFLGLTVRSAARAIAAGRFDPCSLESLAAYRERRRAGAEPELQGALYTGRTTTAPIAAVDLAAVRITAQGLRAGVTKVSATRHPGSGRFVEGLARGPRIAWLEIEVHGQRVRLRGRLTLRAFVGL